MDEVISAGQKEKVTVSRIKTLTEMDSHEEKIHDIVERVRILQLPSRVLFLSHPLSLCVG